MTTITTARQIFYAYPKLPTDAPMPEYVSLGDYEALKVQAGNMSQDKERDIVSRDERIFELQTENEALLALLRQWAEISNELPVGCDSWPELNQVVATTKAALDTQPGNNPSTSRQSD